MAMVTFREKTTRPHGATAAVTPDGEGRVTLKAGAQAIVAVSDADEGFTPLELLDAALASCLAVSIRYAARRHGIAEHVGRIEVAVDHEKAPDDLSRVVRFHARYVFAGEISAEERAMLIAEAHRLCTVGNTIARGTDIVDADG